MYYEINNNNEMEKVKITTQDLLKMKLEEVFF